MALKRARTLIKYLLPVVLAILLGASLRGIDFDKDTNADWAEVRGAYGGPRPARVALWRSLVEAAAPSLRTSVAQPGANTTAAPPNPATHTPPPLNPLQLPPWPVFSAGFALGDWVLSRLPTLVLPPNARVVGLSTAFIHSQALYCAAKLGLADALAAGPLAAGELARAKGVKEDHLRRVLRLLVAAGVFREPRPGEFRGVEAGRLGRGARGLHQRRRPECPRMGRGVDTARHGRKDCCRSYCGNLARLPLQACMPTTVPRACCGGTIPPASLTLCCTWWMRAIWDTAR